MIGRSIVWLVAIGLLQSVGWGALRNQVGFAQNPGDRLPVSLRLCDADGRSVEFGEILEGRPAVLVFGYFRCPELCGVVRDGVIEPLRRLRAGVGTDFTFIYVSIDPDETAAEAAVERRSAIRRYGRGNSTAGWHYLTGPDDEIRELTRAAGFRYLAAPGSAGFAHPSGFVILTPDGTISRYFTGLDFDPDEISAALKAASAGRTGSRVREFLIACLHGFDAEKAGWPWRLVQAAAGATFVLVALGIVALARRERRAGREARP